MADEIIEIGEDVEVDIVLDESGMPIGAIVDDLIVATGAEGTVIDETIDVLDADGNLVLEDEIVSVFDADGNLVAVEETVTAIE
ncbi:unannotated protein [freshwater metagenome]|uniref:Unannotated protein n=1 Tax=freshwater metagenome TaxID=449393 RepID=A0A6J7R650_9ZZZZ|nr:hypothetical protein [Actinomycetota bacterium]MSW10794.1 hypothetical protein [Actinomycetota bacterium]MSX13366.1 hypothetical protein [Actinomycetota bacterium]MSY17437.1 hypothetical protein [Actinomycetota bacterium]